MFRATLHLLASCVLVLNYIAAAQSPNADSTYQQLRAISLGADAISVSGPVSGTDKTLTFETGKLAPQSQGAVVARIGNTSLSFEFEIYRQGEPELISASASLYVCIDPETLRPMRVPAATSGSSARA